MEIIKLAPNKYILGQKNKSGRMRYLTGNTVLGAKKDAHIASVNEAKKLAKLPVIGENRLRVLTIS